MFGTNEIVGKKQFKDEDSRLLVTSIFFTIQGEGPFAAKPAVFVRLAKCNLACWFCDTYFDSGEWLTFDEIKTKADEAINSYFKDQNMVRPEWTKNSTNVMMVITGGEPLLQLNALQTFVPFIAPTYKTIQLESNGIVSAETLPNDATLVISPKCLEEGDLPIRYLKPHPANLLRAHSLKFVLEDKEGPYNSIPDWAIDWKEASGHQIYVSPINVYKDVSKIVRTAKTIEERSKVDEVVSFWTEDLLDLTANQKNHEYAARYCLNNNLKLSLQLHLYASLA